MHEYMMYPQFGGDGYLHLRWKHFFCMRTCDIFSLGEWFLTFFVHTDFYSFTTRKNAKIYLRIYCKPWACFSWNFEGRSIMLTRTSVESFSSIQCTVFEKTTIITYNQFAFLSKSLMWVSLILGVEMNYNGSYFFAKFQPNPVFILWNIGSGSLPATHFYSCSFTKV